MFLITLLSVLVAFAAVMYFNPGLLIGSAIFTAVWLTTGLITPAMVHPVTLVLLAGVLAVLNVPQLRRAVLTKSAYKTISGVMHILFHLL